LGEALSVTIIATGFQTKDEREKENSNKKVVSMLVPENTPMVKPVNEFINAVKPDAEMVNQPYIKMSDAPKQTGLFDLFAKAEEQDRAEERDVIRYNLQDEEPAAAEENIDDTGFTFKVTETVMDFTPRVETRQPEPEPEPEPVVNADDSKTDESIEEQLRKSRERIMRLKDLSMKLRNGNIQEMENVPAYKRKEVALQQTPQSDESQISRFSLMPDGDGKTEIKNNNSFLHDNVD